MEYILIFISAIFVNNIVLSQFLDVYKRQGLYLMLLHKREENAIALAATANNAKIIDEAIADDTPVSPKGKMIYLIALVLGMRSRLGLSRRSG